MRPGHDLDREVIVVAHPYGNWFEQMNQIELAGCESFNQGRPAAYQCRAGGSQSLVFEKSHAMRGEQDCGVGDRYITNAHDLIVTRGFGRIGKAGQHG